MAKQQNYYFQLTPLLQAVFKISSSLLSRSKPADIYSVQQVVSALIDQFDIILAGKIHIDNFYNTKKLMKHSYPLS